MMFRIDSRITLARNKTTKRLEPVLSVFRKRVVGKAEFVDSKEIDRRKSICLKCEWYGDQVGKCMHPRCGCPLSVSREEPWRNLKRCGAKLWDRS